MSKQNKWQWFDNGIDGTCVYTQDENYVAGPLPEDICEQIVREHNSHAELLEALKAIKDVFWPEDNNGRLPEDYIKSKSLIEKAIAKADGK